MPKKKVVQEAEYTDRYVMDEIVRVRDMWGSKRYPPCWDNLFKGLGFLLMRCSDKVRPLVEATIYEANRRRELTERYSCPNETREEDYEEKRNS